MHHALLLASSPCAQLLQQSGDDIISFLAGLFEELSDLSVGLPGLSYSLLVLAARQLLGRAQDLAEAAQSLVACSAGCGRCPGEGAASWKAAVASSARSLEELLGGLGALGAGSAEVPVLLQTRSSPSYAELGDVAAQGSADTAQPVIKRLVEVGEILQRDFASLRQDIGAALRGARSLVQAEALGGDRRVRRGILGLLQAEGAAAAGFLAASLPGEELVRPRWRRHDLCQDDLLAVDHDKGEGFLESSGLRSWHGRSATELLRRLRSLRLARRVYKVLPAGMQGSADCGSAHGVLYDPTSCLEAGGWTSVIVTRGQEGGWKARATLHAPGRALVDRPFLWPPPPEASDLLFVHPMAGNCVLLDKKLAQLGSGDLAPKLVYVGINPLMPPPMRAAPDFALHWSSYQQVSGRVLAAKQEDLEAWTVRSQPSHILAQCSLAQVTAMMRPRGYQLLHVEHLFAVFGQDAAAALLQGKAQTAKHGQHNVSDFEAWRLGWFCSPAAPFLLSLEQLAEFDPRWLGLGALPPEEAERCSSSAVCAALASAGLRSDAEVPELACPDATARPTLDTLGLTAAELLERRSRVQWALRQPAPLPGLSMQLRGSSGSKARGHCPGPTPVRCECFAPWRGPLCDQVDGGLAAARARDYASAIHYVVNEDEVHLAELRHSLRNLWRHFNSRYDHPVQIFHDGLSDETRAGIVQSSLNRVWFHRLPEDFIPPASQLPSELLAQDAERTVSHHTFSAGYRAQCRFRSGPLFEHPAVAQLDYLLSLDTDSMFTEVVEADPIEAMHRNQSLVLGYAHLMISNGAYMKGLWTATQPYLTYRGVKLSEVGKRPWHFLQRFLVPYVGPHTEELMYNNLVVMTDLELLRVSFFRPGSEYFRFFRYLDELGGFWEHRWGDHAVRGLGVGIALLGHERGPTEAEEPNRTRLMSYDLKLPYAHQGACFCQTPGLRCVDQGEAAAGEALWPAKKKVWACQK